MNFRKLRVILWHERVNNKMSMAEKIRSLRIGKGMTQEDLGRELGVQKSAIAKYESGRVENIKRSTILKMANIFDVDPAWLMDVTSSTENDILDEIDVAFLGDYKELTEENKATLRAMAQLMRKNQGGE